MNTKFFTSSPVLKGLAGSAVITTALLASAGNAQAALTQYNFGPATGDPAAVGTTYNYKPSGVATQNGSITGSFTYDTATQSILKSINFTVSKSPYSTTANTAATFDTNATWQLVSGGYGKLKAFTADNSQSITLYFNATQFTAASGGTLSWPTTDGSQFTKVGGGSTAIKGLTGGLSTSVPFPAPILGLAPFALMALRKRNPFSKAKQSAAFAASI